MSDAKSELEQLVERVVATVTMIADRASRFARRLLVGVAVVCIGGFVAGVAALDGPLRGIWIVLGVVFGTIAIGGLVLAMWRIRAAARHVPEMIDEVRTLVAQERDGGRVVIETFDADDPDRPEDQSAITLTRRVSGLQGVVGSGLEGSGRLAAAVVALTRFPLIALSAIAISIVFGFLGLIFLVALAL